jgi:hypothetical protein
MVLRPLRLGHVHPLAFVSIATLTAGFLRVKNQFGPMAVGAQGRGRERSGRPTWHREPPRSILMTGSPGDGGDGGTNLQFPIANPIVTDAIDKSLLLISGAC